MCGRAILFSIFVSCMSFVVDPVLCGAADGDAASRRSPRALLRITPTSSPELGVVLTTDDFDPDKYSGRMPIVRISTEDADRISAFLTDTRFIETAPKRRETCMADFGLISLYYKRDGILRTRYSGVTLQALGYLERLSDAVSPPAQKQILASVQRIKDFNYRAVHGRDMVSYWLSLRYAQKQRSGRRPLQPDALSR